MSSRCLTIPDTPDRRLEIIAIAHHEEEDIPDPKRIPLPGAFDRVTPQSVINARESRVFSQRIDPLAKPTVLRTGIVIAADRIDIFTVVFL